MKKLYVKGTCPFCGAEENSATNPGFGTLKIRCWKCGEEYFTVMAKQDGEEVGVPAERKARAERRRNDLRKTARNRRVSLGYGFDLFKCENKYNKTKFSWGNSSKSRPKKYQGGGAKDNWPVRDTRKGIQVNPLAVLSLEQEAAEPAC